MRLIFAIIFYVTLTHAEPADDGSQKNDENPPEANREAALKSNEKCDEFDLREPGQSMANEPTHDQGNIGDCNAYATSTATDAWLHSNTELTSPLHNIKVSPTVSAFYNKKGSSDLQKRTNSLNTEIKGAPSQTTIFGGDIVRTFHGIKQNGVCNYENIERKIQNSVNRQDNATFVNQITNIYSTFHSQLVGTLEINNEAERKTKENEILSNAVENYHAAMVLSGFKDRIPVLDKNAVRSIIVKASVDDGNAAFANNLCPSDNHFSVPSDFPDKPTFFIFSGISKPSFLASDAARGQIMSNVIDAMLKFKNRQPISIAYFVEALSQTNARGIIKGRPSGCGAHGSLIIARKKTPNGCEFIIRNSWGTQERAESVGWREGKDYSMNMDDNGDVHVLEHTLLRNIMALYVLNPKGEKYDLDVDVEKGAQQAFDEELKAKVLSDQLNQNKKPPEVQGTISEGQQQ